jgi:CMP-N-acetylneuraminic acid synthetase
VAVNHDAAVRPRRQDREPEHRETGAFYALRTDGFRQHRHRFFGRVEIVSVDPRGAIDIDDESDLAQAEAHAGTHHTRTHHTHTLPEPLDPQWWHLATTNGAP